jgi:CRISPR-associated protein Csb2
MAMRALLVSVRFVAGRYHGNHDWPPSPFRLFQALVAGAYSGRWTREPAAEKDEAFKWLERLDAPHIAAPRAHAGAAVNLFVPNNDLDAKDGDPLRVGDIRVRKRLIPQLFDFQAPILYAWPFDEGERHAAGIVRLAERMHTLGLGPDAAFASAEVVTWEQAEARLASHGGRVTRPHGPAKNGPTCPTADSFDSLKARHRDAEKRFYHEGKAVLYSNARKPRFRQVAYDSPPARLLFDLVGERTPWRLDRIIELTEGVRDKAAKKLKEALPQGKLPPDKLQREAIKIDNIIVGRRDANDGDKAARLRITPLPSIGHQHADHAIRRILVEIPLNCPVRTDDLEWAFSGLETIEAKFDAETGELRNQLLLATAADRSMLEHYGMDDRTEAQPQRGANLGPPQRGVTSASRERAAAVRLWRTVTPAALPQAAARRRIDPTRMRAETKGGAERAIEESNAISAVFQSLRHAGVNERPVTVRVQREPFEAKGACAEAFAPGTRFAKERLWHVEVAFDEAVRGPLILGDGRYLGLGLLAPVRRIEGVLAFAIMGGLTDQAEPLGLARALRRAVMARVQEEMGERAALPAFFSGYAPDGAPARSSRHEHLAFLFDAPRKRLLIVAPHIVKRREASKGERENLRTLEDALDDFRELRAGTAGRLSLSSLHVEMKDDPLFARVRRWKGLTPYRVTKHAKLRHAAAALEVDLLAECRRAGFSRPQIEVTETFARPGAGLFGCATLTFRNAVAGPVLLGRDRHFGGGLFVTTG